MKPITYITGDATEPVGGGARLIAHVVNDIGLWGAGFTAALDAKWPGVGDDYRDWHLRQKRHWGQECFGLGEVSHVIADSIHAFPGDHPGIGIWVVNMLAQQGVRSKANPRPLRYDALGSCLMKLGRVASEHPIYSVHMPRIGCGLAGGRWAIVEELITDALCRQNVPVFVYDLGR